MECYKFSELDENIDYFELTDYLIEFDTSSLDSIDEYKGILTKLKNDLGILNFGNYIGKIDFMGKALNVVSKKISQDNYEQMVIDLASSMAQLPFDFNSPSCEYAFIDTSDTGKILYHTFLILKYIVLSPETNLEGAYASIIGNPSRKADKIDSYCYTWDAANINNNTLMSIISEPDNLYKLNLSNRLNNLALAKELKGKDGNSYFPYKVRNTRVISSLDTPENRFVKHFLRTSIDLLENFHQKVSNKKIINMSEAESDIKRIGKKLEGLFNHQLFDEVGEMQVIPFNSTILHKRSGYKEILQFHNMLQSSLKYSILGEKAELVIDNKDIAELYEIWTYLKLVELVGDVLKVPPSSADTALSNDFKAYINYDMCIAFRLDNRKIKVYYNRTFSKGKGSYSLTLRPDITIEIDGCYYIFDAKFKIDTIDWYNEEERKNFTFKNGDVYKMHTYKDAIQGVKFACVLYPNPDGAKKDIFWEFNKNGFGVGAISLLPGAGMGGLRECLEEILI